MGYKKVSYHGYYCDCKRCMNRRGRAEQEVNEARSNSDRGAISGESAVVTQGNTGRADRIDAYYDGTDSPDGPGHGHLVSNDGENVSYWREPGASGPSIDDRSENPYQT